jgi:hypothetical protein
MRQNIPPGTLITFRGRPCCPESENFRLLSTCGLQVSWARFNITYAKSAWGYGSLSEMILNDEMLPQTPWVQMVSVAIKVAINSG